MRAPVFVPGEILLPKEGTDFGLWAVLACDQFTSQPEYWERAERLVGNAPSTLRLVLPEVYLEGGDTRRRIAGIHAAMRDYAGGVLSRAVRGFIYLERHIPAGVRQGLVGCVDLEAYSYARNTQPRIRPSENTVEERIPPRLEVRRGAVLESPHILMLADDAGQTVIEPLTAKKENLEPVYDTELMLNGGRLCGWAVTAEEDVLAVQAALAALEEEEAFNRRYGAAGVTAPFALAVGDGNHSLATAKALWEELKPALSEEQRRNHPARYCLVELENIHCPANKIEPIHRVVFGVSRAQLARAAEDYAKACGAALYKDEDAAAVPAGVPLQRFSLCGKGGACAYTFAGGRELLEAGTADAIIELAAKSCPGLRVDYVHGDEHVRALVEGQDAVGLLLPPVEKSGLFKGVALGGVLPKKTFSMGHAVEKRYYMECRAIR